LHTLHRRLIVDEGNRVAPPDSSNTAMDAGAWKSLREVAVTSSRVVSGKAPARDCVSPCASDSYCSQLTCSLARWREVPGLMRDELARAHAPVVESRKERRG
jgi:hypothetical protein